MLYQRKCINNTWQICSLKVEEAHAIQKKIIDIAMDKLSEISNVAQARNIPLQPQVLAVILSKIVPTYDSLANDFIEGQLKKRLESEQKQKPQQP